MAGHFPQADEGYGLRPFPGIDGDPDFAWPVARSLIGAGLNYAIYSGLLLAAPNVITPLMALVIAVGVVTVFSYLGYSRFVFNRA